MELEISQVLIRVVCMVEFGVTVGRVGVDWNQFEGIRDRPSLLRDHGYGGRRRAGGGGDVWWDDLSSER